MTNHTDPITHIGEDGPSTLLLYVDPPPCFVHKVSHRMVVPLEGYYHWQGGELIQSALPDLPADRREQLMSGICPNGWDTLWGDEA